MTKYNHFRQYNIIYQFRLPTYCARKPNRDIRFFLFFHILSLIESKVRIKNKDKVS